MQYRYSQLRAIDADGNPMAGAKLYFYDGGTTTPKDTYTSYTLGTPNANPVVADAGGLFGPIWIKPERYKAVLKTSADATIFTDDYTPGALTEVLTTRGDLLTRDATGYSRIAIGTSGYALLSNGTDAAWGAIASLSAANVWTANQTIRSDDAGAAAAPFLVLYRNSVSPAASDAIGVYKFTGRNSTPADIDYAGIGATILDPAAASEDAEIYFQTYLAGAAAVRFRIGAGVYGAGTAGGDMGANTANFTQYYRSGVALPFSLSYASTAQTITTAGALVLPHGLGVEPLMMMYVLQCTTGEHGYSIGDRIEYSATSYQAAASTGMSAKIDATNITIRFGANATVFAGVHATTGASVNLTNASWALYVKAFA